ncbi:hypothetical protein BJ165DRAFT_1405852 [Panaeolus papilionaceus]|nr:hypothetical protein BJ165DRAFT_1405852 [Panaeolus papilionaceus]
MPDVLLVLLKPVNPLERYVVDLHDLLVLLNYERARRDRYFHNTRLQEITTTTFQSRKINKNARTKWGQSDPSHRLGIVFGSQMKRTVGNQQSEELELPTNILKPPVPPSLSKLTLREQETIYWRSRNRGGSDTTTNLLECLFDTWPDTSPLLRVRIPPLGNKPAQEFLTSPYTRKAVEFTLIEPTEATVTVTPTKTFVNNASDEEVAYSVIGLTSLDSSTSANMGDAGPVDTIVDLSSMQHGDAGRGYHTEDAFIVARLEDYVQDCLPKFAKSHTFEHATYNCTARRLARREPWDDEMLETVDYVRRYWEFRHIRTFCAFCGVPEGFKGDGKPLICCSRCQNEFYCSHFHQQSAWAYHQHFCRAPFKKHGTRTLWWVVGGIASEAFRLRVLLPRSSSPAKL